MFEYGTYFLNETERFCNRTTERNCNYDITPNSDSIGKTYQIK